jgi:hypothetical protein
MNALHKILAIGVIVILLAACRPLDLPETPMNTLPITDTTVPTTVLLTETPLIPTATLEPATPTPQPTATATLAPWSQPWRIWFRGFSCGDGGTVTLCGFAPDAPFANFSILSDGSGLEPLEMEIPTLPIIPEGLPDATKELALERNISPDGSLLAYVSRPDPFSKSRRLYVANLVEGEASLIFETPNDSETRWYLGGVCWSSDSQVIIFVIMTRMGISDSPPTLYSIRRDGSDLQELFTLDGLVGINTGRCSPDGQEMVLLQRNSGDDSRLGLYRLNLASGQWEQILSSYFITAAATAPGEFQP